MIRKTLARNGLGRGKRLIFGVGMGLALNLLGFCTSSLSMVAKPKAGETFTRFADWCRNQNSLVAPQQHTVQMLLQQAKTQDCQQAEQTLLNTPVLNLAKTQIVDLTPLIALPNLAGLDLSFNQITDISPLAELPKLKFLLLSGNQIVDVQPLARLTNLTYLVLDKNRITTVNDLAGLTKLNNLILLENPLIEKRCPVRPETICIFSNDGQDLYAQAETQYQQGQFQPALETFEAALQVYTKAGDRVKQGNSLNRLGDTYINLGQYAQALAFYQRSAALRRELGDLRGVGISLTSLATAYERLGQYPLALKTLEQALDNIQAQGKAGIPLEGGIYELPKDEGALHNRLALVRIRVGQYPQALRSAQQGLKLYQLLPDGYNGKRYGERAVRDTLGLTYWHLGQHPKAVAALKQAVAIAQEIGDRAGEANSLNHLGEVALSLGDKPQALKLLQQALAIRRSVADKPGEGETLHNLGITLLQMGEFAQASQTLLEAVQIWESLRPGLTDENKVSLVETQVATYGYLQKALIAQNQTEAALTIAERSRARAFVELLAARLGGKADRQFESPQPPTIEQIRQIAKAHNATLVEYSIVGDRLFIWVIQPNGLITLRSVSLQELKTSVEETAEQSRQAASLGRIRGRGLQTDALNGFVRSTRDHLTRGVIPSRGIGVKPTTGSRSGVGDNRRSDRLQQAYQLLITPIADLLPQDPQSRVIFIPHGALFLVPFPALQDAKGTYLIEQHTILTAPSIQVLELTRQQRLGRGSPPAPLDKGGAGGGGISLLLSPHFSLIVGNPTMPKLVFSLGEPPEPLAPLPGAEKEAIAIAQLLGTKAITGAAATEPQVVQQMQTAKLVHLATHGLLDDLKYSGISVPGAIALAPTPAMAGGQKASDGLLTSNEILDLKLKAELVVLSACNTGRGDITGDGVIGLSRSFIIAGVPSVMVSLWEVPDAPTAELMVEFYRQLQQQPDKAQALRQAMLATLKKYPQPRDWAAFTLIGEP